MDLNTFNSELWEAFKRSAPNISKIRTKLSSMFNFNNDHVAFRCLGKEPLNIETLEQSLLGLGYHFQEDYYFKNKNIIARSYVNYSNHKCPRIFLSEPDITNLNLSSDVLNIISTALLYVSKKHTKYPSIFCNPYPWGKGTINYSDYCKVREENEYISWVLANGCVPNHFTLSVNYPASTWKINLLYVLQEVKRLGYNINTVGGEIKGSPKELLEQASTMADTVYRQFQEGMFKVPSCFYEFAYRYKDVNGQLFDGFIENNADKIFVSTNLKTI